jgi:capsular exopolysaccharide synthesis family protein
MAAGVLLAFLRNKLDLCLHTPNDVLKSAGVQVVGTITRSADIKKPLLFQQIANDYQTICANLGLFNTEDIPRKLVITSPGSEEGKTTLAINLAINIVKTGKRVLLIDGDLRKPDIARLLNLSRKGNWLREMLLGKKFEEVVCSTFLARLDVLTACSSRPSDTFKLIARQRTAKIIDLISQRYDLVIIDSPPVLAVPDALLWAKMADAVVITSFADHTEGPELRETLNRFALINVKVLGTVLNNVSLNYSYNSYGYGYCVSAASGRSRRTKRRRNAVLLPMQEQHAGVEETNS